MTGSLLYSLTRDGCDMFEQWCNVNRSVGSLSECWSFLCQPMLIWADPVHWYQVANEFGCCSDSWELLSTNKVSLSLPLLWLFEGTRSRLEYIQSRECAAPMHPQLNGMDWIGWGWQVEWIKDFWMVITCDPVPRIDSQGMPSTYTKIMQRGPTNPWGSDLIYAWAINHFSRVLWATPMGKALNVLPAAGHPKTESATSLTMTHELLMSFPKLYIFLANKVRVEH